MAKLVSADLTGDKLCTLTYTTTDGKKLSFSKNAFDAKIIDHSYSDKGVIYFDKPITIIECYAFCNCISLTSVTIPNSVEKIGPYAFCGCISLTSVTIPDSVKKMEEHAFESCRTLTSVIIGNSVTEIGHYTFRNCNSLTSVIIPNSVKMIGESAFFGCRALTSVIIGNNVTEIGEEAFKGCWGLTNITISDGVISIGKSAFEDCDNVETIALGKNVSVIGKRAFMGQHLKTVICKAEIPPKLEETNNGDGYYYLNTFGNFETLIIPTGCELAYAKSDWNRFITENFVRFDLEENLEYKAWRKEQNRLYGVEEDYDAEYESYLALGGDPEKYRKGCLDNYMDSIGL